MRREGELITPPWLADNGGLVVPTNFPPPRELARTVAACALPLPRAMTARGHGAIIEELEKRNYFPAWQDDPWLGGELVLDIDEAGRTALAGFAVEYDRDDGLRVTRISDGT